MFPEITQLEFKQPETTKIIDLGTSYSFDFSKGEFLLKDGKIVSVTDLAAIQIWIEKVLRTEKFRFKIYDKPEGQEQYGVTIEDLIIGHTHPQAFLEAELKREITTAILMHPRIQSLSKWKIIKNNPILRVEFQVNLIDGTSYNQEVTW